MSTKRAFQKLVHVHLPPEYIQGLDALVEKKFYANRAEAIRAAIKDLLDDEYWLVGRTVKDET